MDERLPTLIDAFRSIRTMCTGIMGYLAMLEQGDFKGGEKPIVVDLHKATVSVSEKLEALRGAAVHLPRGGTRAVDEAAAVIIASESRIRIPLQALSARLDSVASGMPPSHWTEELHRAQEIVREVAAMHDALKDAQAAVSSTAA